MVSSQCVGLFVRRSSVAVLLSFRQTLGITHPHLSLQLRNITNKQLFKRLLPRNTIPECPIEWKLPEKIPFNHPLRTGDGSPFHPPIDMTQHPSLVRSSNELETADEVIKKMFSFDFLGRKYAMIQIRDDMKDSVKRNMYDESSIEVQIALKTAIMRNLNEHLDGKLPIPRNITSYLNTLIFKRKRLLIRLRKWDYKRFEWILEKLDLYFTPYLEEFHQLTRKRSIRIMTERYIDNYKEKILQEYREKLEDEKEEFYKHKLSSLKFIRNEEIECGVEPTVTEEMIEEARLKLLEHQEKLSQRAIIKDESANVLRNV